MSSKTLLDLTALVCIHDVGAAPYLRRCQEGWAALQPVGPFRNQLPHAEAALTGAPPCQGFTAAAESERSYHLTGIPAAQTALQSAPTEATVAACCTLYAAASCHVQ